MITAKDVAKAHKVLSGVVVNTPLEYDHYLSEKYGAKIYLKKENAQRVRSFKIRGAYFAISQLSKEERERGVVCASAGNHAQGVAYTCNEMKIPATIFMPITTPQQKIGQVRFFGGDYVTIKLVGDTLMHQRRRPKNLLLQKNGPLLTRLMIHMYRLAKEQWAMKFLRKLEKNRLPLMLSLSLSVEEAHFRCFYLYQRNGSSD